MHFGCLTLQTTNDSLALTTVWPQPVTALLYDIELIVVPSGYSLKKKSL